MSSSPLTIYPITELDVQHVLLAIKLLSVIYSIASSIPFFLHLLRSGIFNSCASPSQSSFSSSNSGSSSNFSARISSSRLLFKSWSKSYYNQYHSKDTTDSLNASSSTSIPHSAAVTIVPDESTSYESSANNADDSDETSPLILSNDTAAPCHSYDCIPLNLSSRVIRSVALFLSFILCLTSVFYIYAKYHIPDGSILTLNHQYVLRNIRVLDFAYLLDIAWAFSMVFYEKCNRLDSGKYFNSLKF